MNTSRRNSILILVATLVFGIVLGMLVPAVVHKVHERKASISREPYREGAHRRSRFVGTIHRVISPDSVQAEKIRPVTEWAAARIDSIESSANRQVELVFDSVAISLAPVLTAEQRERFAAFQDRAQKNWHRHNGRRRH